MRGCLGFIVFAAILVTVLAIAVVQLLVPAVVTAAVEGSPLVRGQPVDVRVETSLTGVFLHGQIDAIRITGHDLAETNVTIGSIDVTLADVAIIDRTFASASGTLSSVVVDPTGKAPIPIGSVSVSGTSPALTAVVMLDPVEAMALLQARLDAAGGPSGVTVALGSGQPELMVGGRAFTGHIETTPQTATLVVDSLNVHVPLLEAPADGAWTILEVSTSRNGIRVALGVSVG